MSSSEVSDFDFGAGNKEAAECLKEIKNFFVLFNKLKPEIYPYDDYGGPPTESYDMAYKKVKEILDDVAIFLWNPTTKKSHVGAPVINPHVAPILKYEREQLKQIRTEIRKEAGLRRSTEDEEKDETPHERQLVEPPKINSKIKNC